MRLSGKQIIVEWQQLLQPVGRPDITFRTLRNVVTRVKDARFATPGLEEVQQFGANAPLPTSCRL